MNKMTRNNETSQDVKNYADEESNSLSNFNQSVCCNPAGTIHRYVVFIFICFLGFGAFFCYDNPSALEQPIEQTLNINNEKYSILYSVYSWPNIILALFGGYLIDRVLGIRWGAITFALFVAAGQLVFAMGAYVDHFWLMVVGRFIFAIGAESSSVAHRVYTVKWFKSNELNAASGITLSLARFGNTANQLIMFPMYKAIAAKRGETNSPEALGDTLFFGFLVCLLALFCALVLWWFDRRRDRYISALYEHELSLALKNGTKLPPSLPSKIRITPKEILRLPLTFWLLCLICVAFYCAIDPFVSFGQLFYVNKYHMSVYDGNICNGIIFIAAIPGSIVSGVLIDYFGRNAYFIVISTIMALISHCLFAFTFVSPYATAILLGCAFSLLASTLWPSIAYIVPEQTIGTAYGVVQSIENIGTAIVFLLAGAIVDDIGYLVLELFFILLLCRGFLVMDGKNRRLKLSHEK